MKFTLQTASEAELRELFSLEPEDDDLADVIGVCDGEWRYDGNGRWRLWSDENCCDRTSRIVGTAAN